MVPGAQPTPARTIRRFSSGSYSRTFAKGACSFSGPLQNLLKVAGLHGGAAELAKQRLLPQPIAKFVPADRGGRSVSRLPVRFENLMHYEFSEHGMRPARNPETCKCVFPLSVTAFLRRV